MTPSPQPRVLICFDGSEGAVHAIEAAGRLFPGARVTIAHVWHPPLPYGGVSYGGEVILPPDIQHDLESNASEQAAALAERGAEIARKLGLTADVAPREAVGSTWRTLLAAADDVDAQVVIAGSRGFGEFRALMLGSTSTALAHHSRRPLLIVPTPGEE